MKPFDLEAAKCGEKVCTRDGREARFLDVIKKDIYPVVAVYTNLDGEECVGTFTPEGHIFTWEDSGNDLMMDSLTAGYINIFKNNLCGGCIWRTREEAERNARRTDGMYITTIRVEWDE